MFKYSIALDIGATKTVAAVLKGQKIIRQIKRLTLAKKNNKEIVARMIKIIDELEMPHNRIKQIGIGLAGQVDSTRGVVLSTANFGKNFKNIELAKILKDEFKVPVKVNNDVKCFMLAENKWGAGKNYQHAVGLTFGTGIGGALIVNGKVWSGINNTAGEVGHMKVPGEWPETLPSCGCGQKNCWETFASGSAWSKLEKKYGAKKADQIIIKNIALGLNNLAYMINPEIIILGGGLLTHPNMLKKVRQEFYSQAVWPWFKKIKLVKPELGDEAILLGSLI